MISASAVNQLRQKTGGGMMDCKKALQETNGNFDDACEWLRKKGLAAAAKKSSRVAAEGLVAVDTNGKIGVMLELNSETDFVAKNETFQLLCQSLLKDYLNFDGDIESFKNSDSSLSNKKITDVISEHIGTIGENLNLRRMHKISVNHGLVISYIHNQVSANLGKIGVLVGFQTDISSDLVQSLGKQIAMHIAATKPESLDVSQLDQDLINKEREFITEQVSTLDKPDNVKEKMIEGRLSKFYEQVVLLEQPFVIDGKTKISQILIDFGKQHNGSIIISDFARFGLGEGIEKELTNLADDVAAITGN